MTMMRLTGTVKIQTFVTHAHTKLITLIRAVLHFNALFQFCHNLVHSTVRM